MIAIDSLAIPFDGIASFLLSRAIEASWLLVLAWIVSRVVRHSAIVHTVWLVVFLKLLTPPIYPIPVPQTMESAATAAWTSATATLGSWVPTLAVSREVPPQPPAPPESPLAPTVEAVMAGQGLDIEVTGRTPALSVETTRTSSVFGWRAWIGLLFAVGTVGLLIASWRRIRRFRRLLRHAEAPPAELLSRLHALALRLELERLPTVRLVDARISPLLHPRLGGAELLLPRRLLLRLSAEELDAVLAHELAHLKRGDHWVRGLELLTTALFWWYPLLGLMRRQLHRAEERACDIWVRQLLPGSGRAYAGALLKTLEFVGPEAEGTPVLACGMKPQQDWKERLTMIVTERTARPLGPWQRGLVAIVALAMLTIVPTLAEPGGNDEPVVDKNTEAEVVLEEHRQVLEEQRRELEQQQLQIEEQLIALQEEQIALSAKLHAAESRFAEATMQAEAARLEAQGQRKAAEDMRRELETVRREAARAEREMSRERQRLARQERTELTLRRSQMEAERLHRRGEHEKAREIRRELERHHREMEAEVEAQRVEELAREQEQLERQAERHLRRAMELRERGDIERAEAEERARAEMEKLIEKLQAKREGRSVEEFHEIGREAAITELTSALESLRIVREDLTGAEREEAETQIRQLEEELRRLRR